MSPAANDVHLLALPQELQEMIFDFAYPRQQAFKVISKSGWRLCEEWNRRLRRPKLPAWPFLSVTVDKLLVSKAYFVGAAKALIGNQIVTLSNRTYDRPTAECLHTGIILAFMREARVDPSEVCEIRRTRNLKKVTIEMAANHSAFEERLKQLIKNDGAFERLYWVPDVLRLGGVHSFKWSVRKRAPYYRCADVEQQFEESLACFEKYVNDRIIAAPPPTPDREQGSAHQPLYPGSDVCFNCSNLHCAPSQTSAESMAPGEARLEVQHGEYDG